MGSGVRKLLDPLEVTQTGQEEIAQVQPTTATKDLGVAPGGTEVAGGSVAEAGDTAQATQKKKRLGTKAAQIDLNTGISQGGGTGLGGV